jgi:hypothetical protein
LGDFDAPVKASEKKEIYRKPAKTIKEVSTDGEGCRIAPHGTAF